MKEFVEKVGTRRLVVVGCVFVGLIVCMIVGSLIYNKFFYRKTYTEVESIMVSAAKEYYSDHKNKLPASDGDTDSIEVSKLVSSEYMKDISDYLKNDSVSCKGTVNVTNINNNYRYTPILLCGDDYSVVTLTDYIEDNVDIVSSGDGLYSMNNELVYRGENVNNYVTFGEYSYRIVKITDGRVMLIFNDKINNYNSVVWDDRYNTEKEDSIGINDFSVSRIRDSLRELYEGDLLLSDDDKLLLSKFDLYIGKRKDSDTDKTGVLEKANILENQYIGLLPVYDLMNASLDNNCNYTISPSCSNYNYLAAYERSWWTITSDNSTSYKAYKSSNYDAVSLSRTNTTAYIRPIVYLVSDAIYVSGDGSIDKPYKFK